MQRVAAPRDAALGSAPQRAAAPRNATHRLFKMKQPLFRASSDTTALVRLLLGIAVGDLVSWDRMSRELGRDASPIGPAYGATLSARAILERDHRVAFEAEPTQGLRRLDDIGIVESGDRFIGAARKAMRRGIRRLTCADYAALPRQKQVEHNAKVSAMSAIAEIGSSKNLRKIEKQIADSGSALPAGQAAIAELPSIK